MAPSFLIKRYSRTPPHFAILFSKNEARDICTILPDSECWNKEQVIKFTIIWSSSRMPLLNYKKLLCFTFCFHGFFSRGFQNPSIEEDLDFYRRNIRPWTVRKITSNETKVWQLRVCVATEATFRLILKEVHLILLAIRDNGSFPLVEISKRMLQNYARSLGQWGVESCHSKTIFWRHFNVN